jgi:winged helix DNA-binding protein
VIGRLAGLQAQQADSPYVALWSRREAQTIEDLEAALKGRTVVKATVMRSTLHLVDATDYPAFDVATAEGRVANWTPTARRAGVAVDDLHRRLLDFCAEPRTVAEIGTWIDSVAPGIASAAPAGVSSTSFRFASAGGGLVHVPPSGLYGTRGKPSYVAARVWLRDQASPTPAEALQTSVTRYLAAYGPASIADIGKWLGQPRLPKIRTAIASLGDRIVQAAGDDGRNLVDLADSPSASADLPAPARFLSRWDSVLISYDVRDRILPPTHRSAVAKPNGDFLPTFLVDGFVAGLWSIERPKGAGAVLRLEPFSRLARPDRLAVEEEGQRLVRYVAPEAARHEVTWAATSTRTASTTSPCSNARASCRARPSGPTGGR